METFTFNNALWAPDPISKIGKSRLASYFEHKLLGAVDFITTHPDFDASEIDKNSVECMLLNTSNSLGKPLGPADKISGLTVQYDQACAKWCVTAGIQVSFLQDQKLYDQNISGPARGQILHDFELAQVKEPDRINYCELQTGEYKRTTMFGNNRLRFTMYVQVMLDKSDMV